MLIKDKLISNATYLFLNLGFQTFFTMLYWLILGKTLLPPSYGVVATTVQLAALLAPMTLLGLGGATNKLIPEFLQRDEKEKIQGLVKFSFKIVFLTSVSMGVALFLLSPYISPLIKLEEKTLWLTGLMIITMALTSIIGSVYYGFQNMKKYFLTAFYGQITLVLSALILILVGFDYLGAIIAYILFYSMILISRFSIKLFQISKKSFLDKKLIFKYSIPSFTVVVFSIIFNNTQFIILSAITSFAVTGVYAVAMKIAYVITVLPGVLSSSLFPITSQISAGKHSKSKRSKIQSYLIRLVFRYNILLILPLAVAMVVFSEYLILFFSTREFLSAKAFLPILAFGSVFVGLTEIFRSSLFAIGKPKKYRNSYIIGVTLYLLLSIILTYYMSAQGLALAYMFSSFAILLITIFYIKQHLVLKLQMKDVGRIGLATFISFIFLIFTRRYVHTFLAAGILVVFSGVIYSLVLLKLGFFIEEDLKVIEVLAKKSPVFKKQIIKFKEYLSNFVTRNYKF